MHRFMLWLTASLAASACLPAHAGAIAAPDLDNGTLCGMVIAFTATYVGYRLLKLKKAD